MSEVACILHLLNVLIQFSKSIELFNYKVQYNVRPLLKILFKFCVSESEASI